MARAGPMAPDSEHDVGIRATARKRTLDEDIMSREVGAMLWIANW